MSAPTSTGRAVRTKVTWRRRRSLAARGADPVHLYVPSHDRVDQGDEHTQRSRVNEPSATAVRTRSRFGRVGKRDEVAVSARERRDLGPIGPDPDLADRLLGGHA